MKKHLWKYILVLVLVVAVNDAACVLLGPRRGGLVSVADREALRAVLPSGVRHGNSARLFYDFDAMAEDLIQAIDSSLSSIEIAFFHYDDDSVGKRIADHLIERAQAGVQVRFMFDGEHLGTPTLYRKMSSAGIEVCRFNPIYIPWLTRNDFARNHQKIVVIDGRVCYTGGMNIADRYSSGIEGRPWVDMFMRIDGPAACAMREVFAEDWLYACGERLDLATFGCPVAQGEVLDEVELLASGALGDGPTILERYCELLDRAEDYAYFESPYFIPAGPLLDAMKRAAGRGVDVRVIYPDKCDLGCALDLCSDSFVAEALEAGIKVGHYAPGFLHAKLFVTDDVACVGSTNLDSCSLYRYLEMMVFISDPGFSAALMEHFHSDEAFVTYLDTMEWSQRPALGRMGEKVCRALRGIL